MGRVKQQKSTESEEETLGALFKQRKNKPSGDLPLSVITNSIVPTKIPKTKLEKFKNRSDSLPARMDMASSPTWLHPSSLSVGLMWP